MDLGRQESELLNQGQTWGSPGMDMHTGPMDVDKGARRANPGDSNGSKMGKGKGAEVKTEKEGWGEPPRAGGREGRE